MDGSMPPAETPIMRMMAIDLIDDLGNDMRRVKTSARSDAALKSSIARRGVLQAIGVRPVGNRFQVVFGHRRLRCTRELGLPRIPADIRAWSDDEVRAVQGAENLIREAAHPIDTWCTVRDLVDDGFTVEEAAEELGLDPATSRRMERLGRLHPDVLKLAEQEMPHDGFLRIIANAPAKLQAQAVKGKVTARAGRGGETLLWHEIAARCRVERISRTAAIFDTTAHPELWEEDFFAQPDDEDRFTTTNLARFRELQREALAARVAERRARKERVQLAECAGDGLAELPRGYRLISTLPNRKAGRAECVFMAMQLDGHITEVLAEDAAAKKAAERKREGKRQAASPAVAAADAEADDAEETEEVEAVPAPVAVRPGMSKAGLTAVAQLKTEALRDTLRTGISELPLEKLVSLLLLAFAADNVQLRLEWDHDRAWRGPYRLKPIGDVLAPLLLPGGAAAEISAADARTQAGELLARLLRIGGPDDLNRSYNTRASGMAAEWIGAAIGAEAALGRFDTAELLAQVGGEELRRAAAQQGLKATGGVTELRARLAGQMPGWRPDAAAFGAPGLGGR